MHVLGLTGSIGMGKSTAARMLRQMGVPVCDSDAVVHGLFRRGGAAVPGIQRLFPDAVVNGAVDRARLARQVLGQPAALARLEAVVHPLVRAAQQRFLLQASRRRAAIAVLDIPLLYETRADKRVDAVLVVSASAAIQRWRVLRRPGMTPEKLSAVLARQLPDREKRRRADVVIPSGLGLHTTRRALRRVIATVDCWPARHWPVVYTERLRSYDRYHPGDRKHA
jgi:dephospho-CoA kinase